MGWLSIATHIFAFFTGGFFVGGIVFISMVIAEMKTTEPFNVEMNWEEELRGF